jgi:hypothetical protein
MMAAETMSEVNAELLVRTLVERAGLAMGDDELEAMIAQYPQMLASAGLLYFDEVRYDEPALIYTAKE